MLCLSINIMKLDDFFYKQKKIELFILRNITKFGDLFYKRDIISKYPTEILTEESIEEIAKKDPKTASILGIALFTKSEEAASQSEKTISRYHKDAAGDIAYGLSNVAKNTGNKDKIITAAKIMSLDEILNTKIKVGFKELAEIAGYIGDKDAVIESEKTISRYPRDAARDIAYGLSNVAKNTGNKDIVMKFANTISRYDEDTAKYLVQRLDYIAMYESTYDIRAAYRIVNLIGIEALELLKAKDFIRIRNEKLDDLIKDKESFDVVAAYVKSGFVLPTPNKENITRYKELTYKYISQEYGITKNLNTNQILMVFSADKDQRNELAGLMNNSSEKGLKMYSIATEETKKLEMDKSKLPYLSIIAVTGSRDSAIDREAYDYISEIVGEKAVRKARNEFKSNYRNKIKEIANYVNKGEINKAIDSLKTIKNGSIEDVLSCANYSDLGFTNGKAVLSAVESNNPLDYDNRIQIACVYLPRDFHDGIYNYCRDYYSKEKGEGFILIRYNIGEKALGSAICYMEKDKFLVDSVEGHRTFRKPQIFKAVYHDLVERARDKGAEKIIFSENCMNETPNKFIEFLGNSGLKKGNVDMKLNTEGYLEAVKGRVRGYIVNLTKRN